ncbi:MAG: hypothetical protein J6Q89_00325 [Clostridia bacterium]|nr:hypothetical protein [Clostridia bacterium]
MRDNTPHPNQKNQKTCAIVISVGRGDRIEKKSQGIKKEVARHESRDRRPRLSVCDTLVLRYSKTGEEKTYLIVIFGWVTLQYRKEVARHKKA